MWVVETLGAWYRGVAVLQEEESEAEYADEADLDLRGTGGSQIQESLES